MLEEKIEKFYTKWRLTKDLTALADMLTFIEKYLEREEFPLQEYKKSKYKL